MTTQTSGRPAGGSRTPNGTGPALAVDWTACDGRGLCIDLLPELLEPDPWGFPRARPVAGAAPRVPGALTAVPSDLVGPARKAVRLCPKLALRLVE